MSTDFILDFALDSASFAKNEESRFCEFMLDSANLTPFVNKITSWWCASAPQI